MTVYVVVWEDRHADDAIAVCSTLDLANAALESFKGYYDDEWEERTSCKPPWLRDVCSTFDDGPKGHIEECVIDAPVKL